MPLNPKVMRVKVRRMNSTHSDKGEADGLNITAPLVILLAEVSEALESHWNLTILENGCCSTHILEGGDDRHG